MNNTTLMSIVSSMNDALTHRGPDDSGCWSDQEVGVALGHRRLSILDLTKAGHQPMMSASGRHVLTYNGEIYNFPSLKDKLVAQGLKFSGASDTEVLLQAIDTWGIEKALSEVNGMFSFAVWDKKEQVLHLARDRIGKKPLYYGWTKAGFIFGSELKAFRKHPSFNAQIDREALALYTRYNYVPAPWSIYKNIYKLPAASYVSFSLRTGKETAPQKYWDLKTIAERGCSDPLDIPFEDAVNNLENLLSQSIQERMISDVPIGVFLSGGIDSSLISALMQKHSTRPIKSFCIGFEDTRYNEANYAHKIADHLGTDHTEFYVTAKDAQNVIPHLPDIYDEPFADVSQIPTYHVARLARQDVTVALAGDGGDEAFAGYSRYNIAHNVSNVFLKCPLPVRSLIAKITGPLPLKGRALKLQELLMVRDENHLYAQLMSYWKNPEYLVKNVQEPLSSITDPDQIPNIENFFQRMMCQDMLTYLPDDILVKVDRASMAVSLEVRAPLLDHRIIEYAWQLPLSAKIQNGENKRILQSVLERYVPKNLFDRPKKGFSVPYGEWLRGPLKEWAETLLDEKRLQEEGFFNASIVRQTWEKHVTGQQDWSEKIWSILMFQAWHEKQ